VLEDRGTCMQEMGRGRLGKGARASREGGTGVWKRGARVSIPLFYSVTKLGIQSIHLNNITYSSKNDLF